MHVRNALSVRSAFLSLPYLLEDEDVADRSVQDVVDGVCDESCEPCCECECGVCREVACAAQGGGVSPHPAERHEDGTLRLVRIEKDTARGREGETQQLAGGWTGRGEDSQSGGEAWKSER